MTNYEQIVKTIFNAQDDTYDKVRFIIKHNLPNKWLDGLEWTDDDLVNAIEDNNYLIHHLVKGNVIDTDTISKYANEFHKDYENQT